MKLINFSNTRINENIQELFEQNGHLVKLGIEWDDLGRSKVCFNFVNELISYGRYSRELLLWNMTMRRQPKKPLKAMTVNI